MMQQSKTNNMVFPFILSLMALVILPTVSPPLLADDTPIKIDAQKVKLSDLELKIWNSPKFQTSFAESYIAEVEIEPRVTEPEREQMLEVMDLISNDKMEDAAELLRTARAKNASAVFDFTLANIYYQQNKLDQAQAVYLTAVEKYPKFRRAWKNLGSIYVRTNKFKEAIPAMSKVIELGGGDAVTYGLLGIAYVSTENYLSAESAFRMAILLDPITLEWKMGLGRCFFKQQRYGEAVSLYTNLAKQFPDKSEMWFFQANAYLGLNQPLKAAEIYELINQMGKATTDSLNMLGDIYTNEQLYELAANAYIAAMDKDTSGKPDRAVRSAKILIARSAFDETSKLIAQIKAHYKDTLTDDTKKELLKLQARLTVANGSEEGEEVKILEEIIALDPLDGEALILLGQHCERVSDIEKAIFYYERAASIEKYEADAKIRHAQLLVKESRYTEALPLLRQAQKIKPRDNIQKYLEQVERIAKQR